MNKKKHNKNNIGLFKPQVSSHDGIATTSCRKQNTQVTMKSHNLC